MSMYETGSGLKPYLPKGETPYPEEGIPTLQPFPPHVSKTCSLLFCHFLSTALFPRLSLMSSPCLQTFLSAFLKNKKKQKTWLISLAFNTPMKRVEVKVKHGRRRKSDRGKNSEAAPLYNTLIPYYVIRLTWICFAHIAEKLQFAVLFFGF